LDILPGRYLLNCSTVQKIASAEQRGPSGYTALPQAKRDSGQASHSESSASNSGCLQWRRILRLSVGVIGSCHI
jgi:hypothetical protein